MKVSFLINSQAQSLDIPVIEYLLLPFTTFDPRFLLQMVYQFLTVCVQDIREVLIQ